MIDAREWLEYGFKFQGHKCPSMAMGLRAGAAAMNKLGVERANDEELFLLVDVGRDHWATDFVDGLQIITGCTFGKGNIKRTHKGKWSFLLIDTKKNKAVRAVPRAEAVLAFRKTNFFQDYRRKGIPASKVPVDFVVPLIEFVMNTPEEKLVNLSEVFDYNFIKEPRSFNSFVCEECDEIIIEEYGRIKGDRMVCMDCASNKERSYL